MKREQIIAKIKEEARKLTDEETDVFTSREIYPKCALQFVSESIGGFNRPGNRITPDMLPTELLAYVRRMIKMKESKKLPQCN